MIWDQLFCEALLDIKLKRGEYRVVRPGEARRIVNEFVRRVRELRGRGLLRLTVAGELDGLYFVISPDAVIVDSGKVRALLRARIRRGLRAYEADFLLLGVAALLLEAQNLLRDDARLLVLLAEDGDSVSRPRSL
jgi:hypothetical protein